MDSNLLEKGYVADFRVCNGCEKSLEKERFEVGRRICKACRRTQKDGQKRIEIRQYIDIYKANAKCVFCRESHPSALEFHHKKPNEKAFAISDFKSKGYSLEDVKREIEKCTILCANCHRKIHDIIR